ncbi:tRNA1(Val) A37 N6-methylase TrmN6 [Rhodobacter sp. JA431]|uniref:tRNA1(Val) (adenine(37)-N6)-methyltransferase n=1 Tax=Rhodobacter sp. JA431 TaxID=570013 RepID=UPI000BDA4BEE|nr:methyltransferase domain-containing protein [Rhodobacter sp. JA431]SOC15574.1 tRNA1(Val) A37 N6-methylase TrmN6 [Rhodobacter sp. JA431]
MFAAEECTQDRFLDGRLLVAQPRNGYRAAMDPVLLAAACGAAPGQSVLELGCGAGVASLCLGQRITGLRQVGLELQPEYADLARRNATANGIALEVFEGDLAHMPGPLRGMSFDHVIANPPYFAPQSGTAAADAGRERAQREATPLADWVRAGYKRLHPGGWLTLIQNADRLADMLAALSQGGGSISVLPIAPRAGRPAGRVVVSARKLGKGPLRLLAPFVLHAKAAHGADVEDLTEAAQAVLRHGAPLPLVP